MSTKTSIKRIALVAVSALGFGVLTAVAPANAAPAVITATGVSAGAINPTRVGVATIDRFGIARTAAAFNDTMVVTATLTSKPDANEAIILTVTTGSATLTGAASKSLGGLSTLTSTLATNFHEVSKLLSSII